MNSRLRLIDECLQLLRQCDIPAIPKLRLEVQLFQIRLLLLRDDVSRDIKGKFCCEAVLQKIRQQLVGLDRSEPRDVSIEAVGRHLQQIGFDLAEAVATATAEKENRW